MPLSLSATFSPHSRWKSLAVAAGGAAVATILCLPLSGRMPVENVIAVYLLAIAYVAAKTDRLGAVVCAVVSVGCYDFFFVPPFYTLQVKDWRYLPTLGVVLTIALLISGLTLRMRQLANDAAQARVAVESERLRSTLLSSVSHDIRTPLAAIHGAATALASKRGDSEELIDTIVAQSDRLNRQVRNLLDMTKLESGVSVVHGWHDLAEIIGDSLKRTESVLAGREIQVDLPKEIGLVWLDANLLEQALANLLENAARYAPPPSTIEIRVRMSDGNLTLAVLDRGPGVAPEARPHMFEKFNRGTSSPDSFGLGLAIARSALQLQGGDVGMRDRDGGGSEFFLSLSCRTADPETLCGEKA